MSRSKGPIAGLWVLLCSTNLLAASPRLQLQIASCVQVNYGEVGRQVALRLQAVLVNDKDADVLQIRVECQTRFLEVRVEDPKTQETVVNAVDPQPYLELRVDDPITGKTLRRTVDILSAPRLHRERLLAVAISDLVSASWLEINANPEPEVRPVGKVSASVVESIRTFAKGKSELFFSLEPATQYYPTEALLLAGVTSGFAFHIYQELFVGVGSSFLTTQKKRQQQDIRLGLYAARIDLGVHEQWNSHHLFLSVGAQLGVLSIGAPFSEPKVIAGGGHALSLSPMLSAGFAERFWEHLGIKLSVEGGYQLVDAVVEFPLAKNIELRGPWVAARIGLVGLF